MKNFSRTVGGKALLFICTILSLTVLAASICGIVLCAAANIYTESREELEAGYIMNIMYDDLYYISDFIEDDGKLFTDYRDTNLRFAAYDKDGKLVAVSNGIDDSDAKQWQYRAVIGIDASNSEHHYIAGLSVYDGNNADKPHGDKTDRFYEVRAYIDRDFNVTDMYYWIDHLMGLGYSVRYALLPIGIVALAAAIFGFIVLMCVSGRRPVRDGETDEVHPGAFNRIPSDVMLIVTAFAFCLAVAGIQDLFYYDGLMTCVTALLAGTVGLNVLLGLCMSVAARIKEGTLMKNTLTAMVCRLIWRACKLIARGIKKLCGKTAHLFREIPIIWRTVAVFILFVTVELIFILACRWETDTLVIWWMIEKILTAPVIMYAAICLRRLQKAGERLAVGDLDYKADTHGIFWDFKRHAENLNSIADGMSLAVNEKLKSERMKTELITNVSHDIKTPLTSIINYADLISREKCDNEKISEYAEVLARQSDRLKRLIEDLVEASKAATGNLEVSMSLCDANIFISQSAGEYEEKLAAAGLSVVAAQSDKPLYVMADGRRMLRIFDNLMNNICKYAQSGTRVYLSLERHGSEAVITFKNVSREPLNISADELMERFVRGDSSRNTEGNGLGLSIAKSLTELQGGTMSLFVDGDLFKVMLSFPIAETAARLYNI